MMIPHIRSARLMLPLTVFALSAVTHSPTHAAPGGGEMENPDFTQGGIIPKGATHDWNLGPIGARGWMFSNKMETSQARQVNITQVSPSSPADGVLLVGDVVLGLNGKKFSYDPRTEWGKAISAAEATDGKLRLMLWRAGKTLNATIKLPVLGRYSKTAPFNCAKSKHIFEHGCKALAARMKAKPNDGNNITRCYNALALLASGKEEYLPVIRQQVAWAAKYSDVEGRSLHSWFYGPINLLLAEYTLATGDQTYLKDLRRITMEIVRGQSVIGSWGHRFIRDDGMLGGYGMMNAPGLPLTVSLVLARQAGVKDPALDLAIKKSSQVLRFYVGKGSVPYGDHHPWIQMHDDNGKNGIAAILFNLLDDAEAASYFSKMSTASHGNERDTGHTGNFLNMLWAMPGVAIAGPHATGFWMQEFGWYFDLTRRWDGSFLHQGPPGSRPDRYRNWDCSGTYLLAYAQPLRKIYLTGRKHGKTPQLSPAEAAQIVKDGRGWSNGTKNKTYADRNATQLLAGLTNWSPVVRERSAIALASLVRKDPQIQAPIAELIRMLDAKDTTTRIGACQALAHLKAAAAPAVSALRQTLKANDLWLRVKAAEALAAIGEPAKSALPELLTMMALPPNKNDPRGMQQRYLCFALFDNRSGMLRGSLDDVDRKKLFSAIRAGLRNQDGRARGTLASIYQRLDYAEIKLLLPAIHAAVIDPAPSGIMFASGIRMSGLELLAKHHIKEGIPLCLDVMEIEKWGKHKRVKRCLNALTKYQAAARPMLPRLRQLEKKLTTHRRAKSYQDDIALIQKTIRTIENSTQTPKLKSLND